MVPVWAIWGSHATACVLQVYPATMQYLGAGSANVLSIMWFGTLYLLGIDSMFAMVEGAARNMPVWCLARRALVCHSDAHCALAGR